MVFPELESCYPQNKGIKDRIRLDLNFPRINRDGWSDRASLAVRLPASGCTGLVKIGHEHMPPVFGELQQSKNIQMTEHLTKTR
jgi:hypothetical protein